MDIKGPPWLKSLLDPRSYPNPKNIDSVKLIQTHLSWVFLAGDRVYKIKKPVDFGFLDFTTLEKRKFFCSEEIRLNKRLCPKIYEDVVPITQEENGSYRVEGSGEVVEWAVKMKRMPEEGIMSSLISKDEITKADIEGISDILVPFYKGARASEDKIYLGSIDVVRENCEENFTQTEDFVDKVISSSDFKFIRDYTRDFLEKNSHLFEKRQREGFIVEGHGDLYSANICFDRKKDEIYIFDCIEFNERFRYGDVAVDIAFLAMDLDFVGLCHLSSAFIEIFQKDMSDDDLYKLLDFYKCYRAYVRGKIGCFTWSDPGVDEKTRDNSLQQAKRYFKLALRYAGGIKETPKLYVFMGLSGTGKSTISKRLAQSLGIKSFNSDFVRKEYVLGIGAKEKRLEPFGQGIYSKEFTEKTYRALIRLAGSELILGKSVILDATFLDKNRRKTLKELSKACGAKLYLIECSCRDDVAIARLEERIKNDTEVSDGRKEIYLSQKRYYEPPSQDEADELIKLDTSKRVDEIQAELEKRLA